MTAEIKGKYTPNNPDLSLSVEEGPDGQLVVGGDMDAYIEYARKLFVEKEYFGAFARIHVLIEIWMQDLYELHYAKAHSPFDMYKLVSDQGPNNLYRFVRLVDLLAKERLISPEEANRLKSFSNLRDRILHRMLKYSFQTYPWHVVKKDEVLGGFEEGISLAKSLRDKCGGLWTMAIVVPTSSHLDEENTEAVKENKR
jgi:hypothetical protein